MQRDSHDHALLLLAKARSDIAVIERLADDDDIADDIIGFHSQQAVEKLLLDELTPWATQLRYDELLDAERLDRSAAKRAVDDVTGWAETNIAGSSSD